MEISEILMLPVLLQQFLILMTANLAQSKIFVIHATEVSDTYMDMISDL